MKRETRLHVGGVWRLLRHAMGKSLHLDYQNQASVDQDSAALTAKLAESPHLLMEVLHTIYDRVFIKDADGKLIFVNRAFLSAFNLRNDQVLGKTLNEFLPETMIQPCERTDRNIFEEATSACLETHWFDPATGAQRWSESHKGPLKDLAGNITGMVGVSRDITQRRQTENELNHQKKLLEMIVETVPDWIFVKDRQRRVLLGNRAFFEEQGLDRDQVIGTDPTLEMPEETRTASLQSDHAVLETGQAQMGSLTFQGPSGRDMYVEYHKLPLLEKGEVTGIVAMSRNLTEAKLAEEQSRRNETLLLHASRLASLGELSAGIAHEVNQPLYTILNYAKAIENTLHSDEVDMSSVQNWVGQIRKEAERGGEITRRLKSFAKPAETQRKLSSVNTLVTESMQFMRVEARDAGVTIQTKFDAQLPEVVFDRIQIQQVMINLLKNAIDACVEHAVTSPLLVITTQQNAEFAKILVADNGPGVSEGMSILDPFQTTKRDGVGLGLAISNTIIEAHQGQLNYHTNQWGGATFCVSLPLEIDETIPSEE